LLDPAEGEFQCSEQALFAGHFPAIKDDLSVAENIRFWMRFMGTRKAGANAEYCQQVIDEIGLHEVAHQEGRTLSAGQRKRCSLARLLFCDEKLLLLDEPYSNLDRDGIALLDRIVRAHLESGGACIMTTHGSLRPEGFDLTEYHMLSGRHHEMGAAA
jgi:heme exporter protein A